ISASRVIVKLKHDILHERLIDVTTPMEIRNEIKSNLHMDSVQFRTYLNDKRCTDYPFLIWDGNNSQNQCFNIELFTQTDILKTSFLVDNDSENFNSELHQDCKVKVVALGRLVEHLNNVLSENNLRHVKNVVDNMKRTFTIIDDIELLQCMRRRTKNLEQTKTIDT
ncbi:6794_t:CDS:2, partial [Gigaspora rosea]